MVGGAGSLHMGSSDFILFCIPSISRSYMVGGALLISAGTGTHIIQAAASGPGASHTVQLRPPVRPEPTWGQLSIFTWCQHREGRGPAPKSTKMSNEMKPKNDCLDIL